MPICSGQIRLGVYCRINIHFSLFSDGLAHMLPLNFFERREDKSELMNHRHQTPSYILVASKHAMQANVCEWQRWILEYGKNKHARTCRWLHYLWKHEH